MTAPPKALKVAPLEKNYTLWAQSSIDVDTPDIMSLVRLTVHPFVCPREDPVSQTEIGVNVSQGMDKHYLCQVNVVNTAGD